MKKLFLFFLGVFSFVSCNQNQTEINLTEFPQEVIDELAGGAGCFFQQEGKEGLVLFSSGDEVDYICINGETETLTDISGGESDIWEASNETYKISVETFVTDQTDHDANLKGQVTITHLKTNTTKTFRIEGYCGC